ncbi:concanavalin A-like lectin/glucanase domain-containing protein [Tricladium varicosporioides]|nr:concanavalin A-like lectin/glucanase domain-containing protein [Hymenoscyphus varicosporioides]
MKPSIIASLLLAGITVAAGELQHRHAHRHEHAQSSPSTFFHKKGYHSTFLDTFAKTELSAGAKQPSKENWIYDLGTSYPGGAERWGNNEYQTYTSHPTNIQISYNQTLSITPRKLANGTWTSARIETQRKDFVAAPGGKLLIQSSIKLGTNPKSTQQGIWPAFWALGESFRGNNTYWPMASEWDFLEVVSGGGEMFSTLHCGTAPGGPCNEYNGLSSSGTGGVPFTRGVFHTVGFEVDRSMCNATSYYLMNNSSSACWKKERLDWSLDGVLVFNVTGADVGDFSTWEKIAHEGHFLLLNVAVGGNWPGPPNNLTQGGDGANMEVQWVGVWNSV